MNTHIRSNQFTISAAALEKTRMVALGTVFQPDEIKLMRSALDEAALILPKAERTSTVNVKLASRRWLVESGVRPRSPQLQSRRPLLRHKADLVDSDVLPGSSAGAGGGGRGTEPEMSDNPHAPIAGSKRLSCLSDARRSWRCIGGEKERHFSGMAAAQKTPRRPRATSTRLPVS